MLAVMMSWIGTSNCAAIELRVSPACTTYFLPVAGGADTAGAAEGGAADGAGATDGAGDGAAETTGIGVRVAGVDDRSGVTERMTIEGVTVALLPPGRVQAPRTKTLPAMPATRPSRRSPSIGPITPSFPSS